MTSARLIALAAALAAVATAPRAARAWGTPEHIRFGHSIAEPFEDQLGEALPVMTCTGNETEQCVLPQGPAVFGDWVSAPDFARSLVMFLRAEPSTGPVGCSVSWEGLEDNPDAGSFFDFIDCLGTMSMNNNHFGDYAAVQYEYYHQQALIAAQRYRKTRADACRQAAYTLEAWGQHYLTDSTASGHAWNPPGSYESAAGTVFSTAVSVRMRIHDHLNDGGAIMVAPKEDFVFDAEGAQLEPGQVLGDGLWWGDDSHEHTASGAMVPLDEGNAQRDFTLRLSRIGLGQVASAVECGANGFHSVFDTPEPSADPRRVYASDGTMCAAMIDHDVWDDFDNEDHFRRVPDDVDLLAVDNPQTRDVLIDCASGDGQLSRGQAGYHLAAFFFRDRYTSTGEQRDENMGQIAIDPESLVTLEELDCFDDPPSAPPVSEADACGNALCEVPADGRGGCPDGMVHSGGCCHDRGRHGRGAIEVTSFAPVADAERELGGAGAVPGEAGEFLWFATPSGSSTSERFIAVSDAKEQSLAPPAGAPVGCGSLGRYRSWEARVRGDLKEKSLMLTVLDMDDGIKIQVDDHVVAFVDRTSLLGATKIELFDRALPMPEAGFHTVRITTLDSCGDARPTRVTLTAEIAADKSDGTSGSRDSGGGCASSGGSSAPSGAALIALLALWLRRRRHPLT